MYKSTDAMIYIKSLIKMRVLLVIYLLLVICVLLSESATNSSDSSDLNLEVFHNQNQIRIVSQLLAAECPQAVRPVSVGN